MKLLTSWMCRAHCHRVIKLSGTLQQFAPEKELVENVHGVRRTFLDVGDELRTKLTSPQGGGAGGIPVFGPDADPTAYFIGKMLWSKGLASLMDLMKYAEESAGLKVKMDMYGGGPDKDEASAKAAGMALDMPFHGPIDHAELGAACVLEWGLPTRATISSPSSRTASLTPTRRNSSVSKGQADCVSFFRPLAGEYETDGTD